MAITTANLKLGRATVTYNSIDLGETAGDGVSLTINTDTHDTTIQKFGSSPVKKTLIGQTVSLSMTFAEYSQTNLAKFIPMATLTTGSTEDQVEVGNEAGVEMTASALVLHPVEMATDLSEDYNFHKVIITNIDDIVFDVNNDRTLTITAECIIDDSKDNNNKLFTIGTSD